MLDPASHGRRGNVAHHLFRFIPRGHGSLATVTVHPQFEENRWVYLYFTYNGGDANCDLDENTGPVNRCSRFVMNDDWTLNTESELVLFQSTPLPDKIHNGGE